MRLVPEKSVDLGLSCELEADVSEVVAEGICVEASGIENLSRVCRYLSVMNVVLQE